MTKDELRDLNLIKTVHRKGGKYAVNGAPFQTVMSLVTFLFKHRSLTISEEDLRELLDELCTDEKVHEKDIQVKLHKWWGGQREVHTPVGYIDLLTDDKIVEVKKISDFKHSVGQILSYSKYYPNHQKAIYLYGAYQKNLSECYELCKQHKILLFCELY